MEKYFLKKQVCKQEGVKQKKHSTNCIKSNRKCKDTLKICNIHIVNVNLSREQGRMSGCGGR